MGASVLPLADQPLHQPKEAAGEQVDKQEAAKDHRNNGGQRVTVERGGQNGLERRHSDLQCFDGRHLTALPRYYLERAILEITQ